MYLHEGRKLAAIFWPDSGLSLEADSGSERAPIEMHVVHEGSMPWAHVRFRHGKEVMYNLRIVESVELLPEED